MNESFVAGFGITLGILTAIGLVAAVLLFGYFFQLFLKATYIVIQRRRK